MVVKLEKFEKTSYVKKMTNLRNTFYQEREMQYIMEEFYLNQEKDNKNNLLRLYQKLHWPTF